MIGLLIVNTYFYLCYVWLAFKYTYAVHMLLISFSHGCAAMTPRPARSDRSDMIAELEAAWPGPCRLWSWWFC